jgi:hypothetical protein
VRRAEHVARIEEIRNAYKILVGKPEGKRLLERPRRSREYNIRIDLRERGWGVVDWMHLAQGRNQWLVLVNTFEFNKRREIY